MINDVHVKDLCRKLKPALGGKADALWLAYVTAESQRSKEEFASTIELLGATHLSAVVDDDYIFLPPPSTVQARGEFRLGIACYGKREMYPLGLNRDNLMKHVAIAAITGAGKSNVGYLLLLGLLEKKVPFLVVDWKRSYRHLKSLSHPDVSRLAIYTIGRKTGATFSWNPLCAPPGVHPRTWIAVIAESLERSHVSGQGVADIFMELLDELFEASGRYEKLDAPLPNFHDARELLERRQFRGRRMLWQDSCLRILRSFTFGPSSGAFNARHPVQLEGVLTKPVIFELDQEMPKPLRVFFSDILLRWIHLYRLGQGETDSLRHVTVLEEVHNLFPNSRTEHQSTNSLEIVFREIRGFGEGLVNITQHPSLLPIYVLGNCNTQIYMALQHEDDIQTAKRALFLNRGEEVFLDRLKVGEGIIKIKGRFDPCHVKFPLVGVRHGSISDEGLN